MNPVKQLPPVGRICGLKLQQVTDPKKCFVELQYTDHKDEWYEAKIPLLDALYLLNLLKAMSRDNGYDSLLSDVKKN